MITITKEEIVSSSKAGKNFGQIMERLKSGQAEKILINYGFPRGMNLNTELFQFAYVNVGKNGKLQPYPILGKLGILGTVLITQST